MSVLGAVLWLVMRWPPGPISHVAGLAMIGSACAVAAAPLARAAGATRATLAAVGAATVGGAAEVAGLYHDLFGRYAYTRWWQPTITLPHGHTFPLLVPVVWFVILAASYAFARQRLPTLAAVAAAGLLATLADAVAESVLTRVVGFWTWLEPTPLIGAPYQNAVAWLLTSLTGCGWIAFITRGRVPAGIEPRFMLVATLLGVAVIGVTHGEPRGLWALALVGPLLAWRTRFVS